jgi:hypothetical protein
MAVDPKDISLEEYNKRVIGWGEKTGRKIRDSIRMLTSKGKGDLLRSLRLKTGKWYGEVDKLAYHFERHGVFLHKGLGRGYAMVGGKVMRVSGSAKDARFWGNAEYRKAGIKVSVSRDYKPKLLTSQSIKRKPIEWYNRPIERNIPQLADMIAEMNADKAVNATNNILIK